MATSPLHHLAARLLGQAAEALDPEQRHVLQVIADRTPIARDAADVADARATFGERLADQVAAVGGSWGFIIAFTILLAGWMLANGNVLVRWNHPVDPYPFIFLNLMLSTLAAVQAPIIMMSQNRQAAKDRVAASLDYEVNLRAELEILRIHEKLDSEIAARLDRLIEAAATTAAGRTP